MLSHFFSAGFRPMFLLGAIWSALCVLLWIAISSGLTTFDHPWVALDWHVHEMVFGYGSAALAGFLLTAIPNWTGREAVKGTSLALLTGIWVAGRAAVFWLPSTSPILAALIDVSFPIALCVVSARELIAANNRRNFLVVAVVATFAFTNLAFHWQAIGDGLASQSGSARFGIVALILLISIIGGRIVPMFTRNWLKAQGADAIPPAFNRFDGLVLIATAPALTLWALHPDVWVTAPVLALTGLLHVLRLARWRSAMTWREPLLVSLHVGYGFMPLGMLLLALAIMVPEIQPTAGLHALTAGAIGVMTLTVMTRASLGHTGRKLKSHPMEAVFLGMVIVSAVLRILAGLTFSDLLLQASSSLWICGFGLFVIRFLPIVIGPRVDTVTP